MIKPTAQDLAEVLLALLDAVDIASRSTTQMHHISSKERLERTIKLARKTLRAHHRKTHEELPKQP